MVQSASRGVGDMNEYEDRPPRLTDEEIFAIFDVIHRRGNLEEAGEEIHRKVHSKRSHRTTVAAVFNVGRELFKRGSNAPDVLTDQEVHDITEKAGYGVSPSRVVRLHRLYQLWEIHTFKEKEKQNVDTALSTLAERRLKVWFLRLQHWDEGKIAEKLDISLENVQYDIEETEKELASKTKEETKMEQSQSMVNLPPWVKQAQWEHLEGREQRDEIGGMAVVTYPGGIGICQQLGLFQGCFSDINPWNQSFWCPLDEVVMAQLHGHLRDQTFWEQVEGSEGFIKKAKECEALLDTARKRFTSSGEELAPLQPSRPTTDVYITSGWARRTLVRALSRELGFAEPREYHHSELKDGDFILEDEQVIYRGPDVVASEQKHRQLVKNFRQTKEFSVIVSVVLQ
jgi:DNA-directed RNA polymerase specialized sigma24 family protein